ncbi:hypothetical protein [Shewanella sp. NIFS-20-20]|uniref:hypothetical protein n=1 Tax=Shewanella sp. NIFS-20-20 TaxID=2853806 RepID=UPI001C461D06|nr:hypothetical protein [Shewanella sp. NIFS-20-20]MBV7317570.1 hypothetical protein [Shewanella sp. NIFS-20-20]
MSLNELSPKDTAKFFIAQLFGDEVTQGKIVQISNDTQGDRLWEKYLNGLFHQRFYSAYAILREAFSGGAPNRLA